jgi:hypothetical protein
MGWYTLQQVDTSNQNASYPGDQNQISGHDMAAVVVWKGTPEFDALDRTFTVLARNYQRTGEAVPLS